MIKKKEQKKIKKDMKFLKQLLISSKKNKVF